MGSGLVEDLVVLAAACAWVVLVVRFFPREWEAMTTEEVHPAKLIAAVLVAIALAVWLVLTLL